MLQKLLFSFIFIFFSLWVMGQNAWINEIHYDNYLGDVDETVEVVIENAGSYTLSDFQIDLYNGSATVLTVYNTKTLDAFTTGNTVNNFTIYYFVYPTNGIQNGAPDGLCLSYQGTVITGQFLSYEGTFTAADGPASGMTSTDIGVSESSSTPVGFSLQLSGAGTVYSSFTWLPPALATSGALNTGQTFGAATGPDNPTNFYATAFSTTQINLVWIQNGNSDDVMVAWSPDGTFGTPVDGTSYSPGDTIPGGDTVLYKGSAMFYNHTGLSEDSTYYYKAWSVDGSNNYSSGVTDDATTLKDEPSNHVMSFLTGTQYPGSIPLTWNDNNGAVEADRFLILINETGIFTPPTDGTAENDDTNVSDGSGKKNVDNGDEQYLWTGLKQSTVYYFIIYPYTNYGTDVNYKIGLPVPVNSATTTTSSVTAGDIIIVEVMKDPSDTTDALGEWFEIYNTTGSVIDINRWLIKDVDFDSLTISNGGPLNVPANGFLVLGRNSDLAANGGVPVDFVYSNLYLGNTADELLLVTDFLLLVDSIGWDGGPNWPNPTGASMVFTGIITDDNNLGVNWSTAVAREKSYDNTNFTGDHGSPKTNGIYQSLNGSTTWTGTGNWSEGNAPGFSNWANGAPGPKTDVTIDGDCTVDLDALTPASCADLLIINPKTLTVPPTKAITVNGTFTK